VIGVTENLNLISDLLAFSAIKADREPESVNLLAVSKKQPVAKIIAAAEAGQRHFGENFVQEGLEKIAETRDRDLLWHFIGHLQNNKTRAVAENFDWVHTLDSLKTARRLSVQRPAVLGPLNVCIQVNVDNEASKSGVSPEELAPLAASVAKLEKLQLRGLMCLPITRSDAAMQSLPFARLRKMAESLRADGVDCDTLSMGMSGDYDAAIQEGATIVRIGTALFGERK
jgi:pyridoxal phosphate enzyme (YggS family)